MGSDFPLDHETVRDDDNLNDEEDDGFYCYFSDSDDSDDLPTGETQEQVVSMPFVMPALKLGPMALSKDETKDTNFLESLCMEGILEYIDYRFEERGTINSIALC